MSQQPNLPMEFEYGRGQDWGIYYCSFIGIPRHTDHSRATISSFSPRYRDFLVTLLRDILLGIPTCNFYLLLWLVYLIDLGNFFLSLRPTMGVLRSHKQRLSKEHNSKASDS